MVKISDVAKLANVSQATVSRVLNQPELVKEETKVKVQEAIESLKYERNVIAKNLVTGKTGIISLYIPEDIVLSQNFVTKLIIGITEFLSENEYSFIMRRNLQKLVNCDGYIAAGLTDLQTAEIRNITKKINKPLVISGSTDIEDISFVDVNNIIGAEKAIDFLIENGHKNIGIVLNDENKLYVKDRLQGYKNALFRNGIEFNESNVFVTENSVKGGKEITKEVIKRDDLTAFFCITDRIAKGLIYTLENNGKKVPEDLSIIGYDGIEQELNTGIELSTIRQPVDEIANLISQKIIKEINKNDNTVINEYLIPTLVKGKTVKNIK